MTDDNEDDHEAGGGLGGPKDPPAQSRSTRFIRVRLEDELDLHAFAPRDVPSVVEEYLRACREKGLLLVRVVHGRGRGVQRAEVHRVLRRMTEDVEDFADAPPASGGWGATLVRLRPRPAKPA